MGRLPVATIVALAGACICLAQEPVNRAPNPGFEEGAEGRPAGWSPSIIKGEGAKLAWTQTLRSGRCVSIESTSPDTRAGWAADRIPVVAGDTLRVNMQVKLEDLQAGPGGAVGFRITCHFYDEAGYLTWAPSPGTMASGDWREERFECQAPAGAVYAVLGFRLDGCTGRAWVDDVVLHARAPERDPNAGPYGLQPGDPGTDLTVAFIPGDLLDTNSSHQLVDLLNHEGIAAVCFDRVNATDFPTSAEGLGQFAAVLIGGMNPQTGAGILSADQQAALRSWVQAGGGLVACANAVAGTDLAACLPAQLGEPVRDWHFIPEPVESHHEALGGIHFPWPGLGFKHSATTCHRATPREGAQVLATVPEQVAGAGVPFLVCGQFGSGRMALINSTWTGSVARDFVTWRYAPRLLGQLTRWAAGLPQLTDRPDLPDPRQPIPYGGRWHGAEPPVEPQRANPAALPQATFALPGPDRFASSERPITGPARIEQQPDRAIVTFANGVRLVMHHSAQIELFAPDGTRLTAEPADEQPLIATSGEKSTDLLVDVEHGASEPQIFKEPIENATMLAQNYHLRGCEPDGAGVTFIFDLDTGGEPAVLRWSFQPRTVEIEGALWSGVGDRYEVEAGGHFIDSIMGRYPWRIGDTVADDRLMRLGCYGSPRGWYELPLDITADSSPNNAWSFFASGQPFHVLGGREGTLLLYYDEATQIRARQMTRAGRDAVYLDNRVVIGRLRGTVSTPRQWMLFAPAQLDENLWLSAYDHIKREYAARYGVAQTEPVPCGQLRADSLGTEHAWRGRTVRMNADEWTVNCLNQMAEYWVPLAAERGIRRLDLGSIVNLEHPLDTQAEPERVAAIRRLIAAAHERGIECFIYWRITFWNQHAPLVLEHPEWWERKRDGTPFVVDELMNLSLRSGWYDWSLAELTRLRAELGIDGMWFDSLAPAMDCVNYAEPEPQPVVRQGIEYFRDVRAAGLDFWVEGMHPLGLDSFWYRKEKYGGPFEGREFCLANSSMYSHGPDSLIYLDPFRLAAFRAPMMADLRELTVAEDPLTGAQARANRIFNVAADALGPIHAVRATDFGSVWVGERGWAVFAFEDRRVELTDLPAGDWTVTMPESRGGSLTVTGDHITGHMLSGEAAVICR